MPVDEDEIVTDLDVKKLSVVTSPAVGEEWMLYKSEDEDNEEIEESDDTSKSTQKGGQQLADKDEQTPEEEEVEKDEETSEDEEVEKAEDDGQDKELVEIIEKQQDQIDELQKQLEMKEYMQKAKSDEFSVLQGETEERAATLRAMDKQLGDEHAQRIRESLRAASKQVKESDLMKSQGTNAQSNGSASAKVEEKAKQLVQDGEFENMTKAKAHVWKTHNELREQYEQER